MRRPGLVLALMLGLWGLAAAAGVAQDAWPVYPLPKATSFTRGPGFYLSTFKIVSVWVVFACWVATTDWLSQDCVKLAKMDYGLWNPIVFGSFFAAMLLVWLLPVFVVSFVLLLLAYVVPLTTYIVIRNSQLPPHEKVMTPAHVRTVFARLINKFGGKMSEQAKAEHETGPEVQIAALGAASDRENNINLLTARQSPAFNLVRQMLAEATGSRADAVRLDYTAESVGVQYQIDGVWHTNAPLERANGDGMLAVMKKLANLKPDERRARQQGQFAAVIGPLKTTCKLLAQGTPTGEAAIVQLEPVFDRKRPRWATFEDLGMRVKMLEQLQEILGRKHGMLLVSASPVNGLTTTFYMVLETADRFIRNFAGVDDLATPERDVENVPVTTYDSRQGETPATVLPKLIRTYPDAIVVRDLVNGETVRILCEQVTAEDRFVIASIRAKEAVEALLRVLAMQVPAEEFAPAIAAVLNVRLVRKLCEKCKEAYAPPAEVLQQLGLPPGRIEAFYRPPAPPAKPDDICQECKGIGYKGRTGIFELLVVDDLMREALEKAPKLDVLRKAARASKHRALQDEGLLLVARGTTSLPELLRVLKG